jgi:hypothetical protein
MTESTGNVPSRISMSYRREDTAYPAGWLYDRLAGHFARGQVFKDIDSIELGDDFVQVITAAVESCDVLLALIGDRWLTVAGQDGRRRLDNPDDFVRLEIEAALARDVRVIPILVEGARMPSADELPASLAKLARRQALELSPSRFDDDSRRLLRVLERAITEAHEQARLEGEEPRTPVVPTASGAALDPATEVWAGTGRTGAAPSTEHWTSSGAARLLAAGFGVLLITFCIDAVLILQNKAPLGLAWALVVVDTLGIAVTVGGVRKNAVLGAVLLWDFVLGVVYWLSIVIVLYHEPAITASMVLATVLVIAAIGNAGFCIWILVLRTAGRDVDPFLAIFAGLSAVGWVLAAIAWTRYPSYDRSVWYAAASVAIVNVLVGLPALVRALRAGKTGSENQLPGHPGQAAPQV